MSAANVTVNIARTNSPALRCQIDYEDSMTVCRILEKVSAQDGSLAYRRFCCKIGQCLSCLVRVNGKMMQGCKVPVAPGAEITLEVSHPERIIRDLVTDFDPEATRLQPVRSIEVS